MLTVPVVHHHPVVTIMQYISALQAEVGQLVKSQDRLNLVVERMEEQREQDRRRMEEIAAKLSELETDARVRRFHVQIDSNVQVPLSLTVMGAGEAESAGSFVMTTTDPSQCVTVRSLDRGDDGMGRAPCRPPARP